MPLRKVHLELARDHDHPTGSPGHGYDFVAPLDDDGHLLADEWKKVRERCRVRRFNEADDDQIGMLVHGPGGRWFFDYDPSSSKDDEKGFKFDRHRFVPGEYVSITEHDGVQRTFFIKSVISL
jgi:hypothetical protein